MRTKYALLATVMNIFFIMGLLGGPASAGADTVKLTYSNFFPPTHIQSKLAQAWCDEVAKRTEGRVKIDYFPGQTLTKARVVYDGVVNGLSDVGLSVMGYTRGRFPLMEVIDLPLGYNNGTAATKVANAVVRKFKPKELSDTEVMYLHAHGPGLLHTKGKAVRTRDDLKGLKIRAHGLSAKVVKALGGTPVAMPMPETYQSLQKGVVDGAMYPMESNKGWKLGEVTDYGTLNYSMAYTTTFFVVMNKDKWASIGAKDQAAIRQINKEWIDKHGKAWDESDAEGRKFFESKGHEYLKMSAAEAQAWKEAVKPVIDDYVKAMKAKGLPGDEALEFTQKALAAIQ